IQSSVGTHNAVSGSFFPLPGLYNINGSPVGETGTNLFGSVTFDWKVFQFGKQKKLLDAAGTISGKAMQGLHSEQLRIQSKVSRAYFRYFYHEALVRWARTNTERVESILRAAVSRAAAGLSPGVDSLLANATLGRVRADLHLWQGRREESGVELTRWLNMPPHGLELHEVSILHLGSDQSTESDVTHPVIAFKQAEIAHAKKQKELASLGALPSLSVLGGAQLRGYAADTENLQRSYRDPVHNYAVGLGLTWNLGEAFDSRLKVSRRSAEVRQREAEAESLALSLRAQEDAARMQLLQARRQIADAEDAFESAKQAYVLFEARYSSGLVSITELLQMQDVLQEMEKVRIESYYEYWTHHVNLAEAVADFSYVQSAFE